MAFLRSLASRLLRNSTFKISDTEKLYRSAFATSSASAQQNAEFDEEVEKFKASLDDDKRQQLEDYMAEYEIFKYADSRMPSKVAVTNWRRLMLMESKSERIQYLTFLYDRERIHAKELYEKMREKPEVEEYVEKVRAEIKRRHDEHIYYGIGGSSLFRRILECQMNKNQNNRLAKAMELGPHLVIDMSFYPIMRPVETSLTSKQLITVHHQNRAHRFPHHLIFSGCDARSESWVDVDRYFTKGLDKTLNTVTRKHYLDLFPREKLIYLSPDAKQMVTEYDPNKVYIIGACVDKIAKPNLTLGRAKEEGIEARRLPLERCARIIGTRSLCLNHIVGIMNDALALGSMSAAILNNVPKRKVVPTNSPTGKMKREYDRQRVNYLRSIAKTN